MVLIMYIHKICVLKKVKCAKNAATDQVVISRINYVLKKIIILTLCYEFVGMFMQFIIVFITRDKYGWDSEMMIFRELVEMIEAVLSASMVYLMIEHNDEHYQGLLRILNKCKLCYCLDDGTINKMDVEEPDKLQQHQELTVDTKTIHKVPTDHEANENSSASDV